MATQAEAPTAESPAPEAPDETPQEVARLESRGPEGDAPEVSPRPEPRRQPRQANNSPPVARSQASNADRDSVRGQQDGAADARSSKQASSGTARTAEIGNAAIDNWRGQVLRKLQRLRKSRVGSRGTAMVQFSVAASGAVTSVSVSRSSGSRRVDQAAAAHVRRAGPFQPPPFGSAVTLVVAFESQG